MILLLMHFCLVLAKIYRFLSMAEDRNNASDDIKVKNSRWSFTGDVAEKFDSYVTVVQEELRHNLHF